MGFPWAGKRLPVVICRECNRRRANQRDEGDHNTGACGCSEARSLCWWDWNGERCLPRSVYDKAT